VVTVWRTATAYNTLQRISLVGIKNKSNTQHYKSKSAFLRAVLAAQLFTDNQQHIQNHYPPSVSLIIPKHGIGSQSLEQALLTGPAARPAYRYAPSSLEIFSI